MLRKRMMPAAMLAALLVGMVPAMGTTGVSEFRGVRVMPGGVVLEDRIVYEGGNVIVLPAGVDPDSFDSCPSGSLCLFENANWSGAMMQLSTCCAWHDLAAFGFNNIASSWRNRKNVDGQIALGAGGGSRLCQNNNSYASSMPGGWSDTASSIRVRDSSTYC